MTALAVDHRAVLDHFGAADVTAASIYPYAPVFACRIADRPAVVKRTRSTAAGASDIAAWTTQLARHGVPVVAPLRLDAPNPVGIDDHHWVAYPYIDGRHYSGDADQITEAGDLLGRIHAAPVTATAPPFDWPDPDDASVAEDVEALTATVGRHDPAAARRLADLVTAFGGTILPAIRDADLPHVAAVMDYKANNLVYAPTGPVLVDPDNADHAPRILDLALAAVQFHIEHAAAPPRMFTGDEWHAFATAYTAHVRLTDTERRLWPAAIDYMHSEFGVWSLIESDDWDDDRERAFLLDMATADATRFPLP